jgi:hypothetical protein
MDKTGIVLVLAGLLGLLVSLVMHGRRKGRSTRPLPGNFDFGDRKHSENRR